MTRRRLTLALPALCAAEITVAVAPVHASHGELAEKPISEIQVHAQKRDQMLKDAPVSISVAGRETLDDWTISSLENLQQAVPNLKTYAQFAYNNTLSLRGVGTFSRNIGFDERVGLYQDGIYLGPSYGLNQNLLDVEQVEVLRGPQGTFFGRNAIAGAVTLISAKPGDTFEAHALARMGNHGSRTVQAHVAGPLSDGWAISLAGGMDRRDGLTRNLHDDTLLGNRDRTNIRAQLLYRADPGFEAHLSLDRNHLNERMLIGDPNSDSFSIAADASAPAPFEVAFNDRPTQSVETRGAGLTLGWTFGSGLAVTSLSGLRATDANQLNDTDYSPADIMRVDYAEEYRHFSQELRLTSPNDRSMRFVLGFTFLDQTGKTDRHAIAGSDALAIGIQPGEDMINIGSVETKAWGIYGNLDVDVSEKIVLSAGLRWSRDKKEVDWTVDTTSAPFFFLATGTLQDNRHDTDLSPTISLTYSPSETMTTFLRYGEGYKSGGYNLDYVSAAIFPDQLDFRKEKARSFEGGIKGSLMGGAIHYSATLFWVDYDDYQVNQFLDLGGGSTVILISNAAKVRTRGVELEWSQTVGSQLDLHASLALLDARYREFESGGAGGTDVSGNHLDAPDVETSLLGRYRNTVTDALVFYATASYSFANGFHTTPDNVRTQPLLGGGDVPFGYIDARHQVGLKAGFEGLDSGWRLGAFVQNALGHDGTISSLRDFFGTIVEARTVPRIYGVELQYSF